jgi:outer membrane protein insertion porin family
MNRTLLGALLAVCVAAAVVTLALVGGDAATATPTAGLGGSGSQADHPPMVLKTDVGDVTATGATIQARINPHGSQTSYHVEWGATSAFGSQTPDAQLPRDQGATEVTVTLTGLTPATTYVVRVVATNAAGSVTDATRLDNLQRFASLGTFTSPSGPNPRFISRGFQPIGADTELLGNFEYRVPLVGTTVSAAAFADIGTVFNLRKKGDQVFSTVFQPDSPFLSSLGFIDCPQAPLGVAVASLSALAACDTNSPLALSLLGGLVARDGRIVTRDELNEALRVGPVGPDGLPYGFQSVFLRGEAQTNTAVRLTQSQFSNFGDFRSSLGAELRIQLPVVNVPFRLIYAYNPQARRGLNSRVPLFFREDRSAFRFSIGRTF